MLKPIAVAAVLLATSLSAQAQYTCPNVSTSQVITQPQQVAIIDNHGQLTIDNSGNVSLNGKYRQLPSAVVNDAKLYQQTARDELPVLYKKITQQLDEIENTLTKLVKQLLGKQTAAVKEVHSLRNALQEQVHLVLAPSADGGFILSPNNVARVESNSKLLFEKKLGALLQIALNESGSVDNLQGLFNELAAMKSEFKQTWQNYTKQHSQFLQELCRKAQDQTTREQRIKAALAY